jgi:hypothetical protein
MNIENESTKVCPIEFYVWYYRISYASSKVYLILLYLLCFFILNACIFKARNHCTDALEEESE